MSTTADSQNRVTQAIAEYMRRVDAGEAVDRDQFIESHSEVADDLRRYLDNVALVEQMAGPTPSEQSQSPSKDAARRETVSASQSGDSVPEKKATIAEGALSGMFGRYKIEKTLGEGAMGTVYLARDTQLDRRVALKVPKFKDDDTEMMERFYREARSAAKLRHRHICPVHDIGDVDGIKYISIAYIEGHPLSAYVSPDKPQTERNVAIIVRKLALALDVAHREGIIHRDLKPANVMVDKKTEPIIMDFGLARQMNKEENERLTQTGTIMGSPAYMSPEQVNADNDKIGPCSDIYSLGVMLYELLTARLPFEGSIAAVIGQILMKEPDKPSTFRPDLDPRLEAICEKMMAKEIDERYASMKEVADALTAFLKNPTKPGEKRSVGKLESFAPVELKEVAKKSKKRRTVAREKTRPEPADTFATRGQASGGRQPADTSIPQSAFDRLKNLPRKTKAIAGGLAGLVLLLGITIIIKIGNQTVEVESDKPYTKIGIGDGKIEIETGGPAPPIETSQLPPPDQPLPESLDDLATGEWVDAFANDPPEDDGENQKFKDGVLELNRHEYELSPFYGRNIIVRAKVRKLSGQNVTIASRHNNAEIGTTHYAIWMNSPVKIGLGRRNGAGWKPLKNRDIPQGDFVPDKEGFLDLAFATIRDRLSMYVNGTKYIEVTNEDFPTGAIVLSAVKGRSLFKDVQVMQFDDVSSDLPAGQWVRLLENEEQLKQWRASNCKVSFSDGILTLSETVQEKKSETAYGSLEREFNTNAQRFIVHVRHDKQRGNMAGEDVVVGRERYSSAHTRQDDHELWTNAVGDRVDFVNLPVHKSTDGYAGFADFDYVVIDGEFMAYLNGQKMNSHKGTIAPLTSLRFDIRRAEANWKDIAVMRLTDEQVAAIRAGNLPKYVPAGEEYQRPDVLLQTGIFKGNVLPVRYTPDGRSILGIQWGNFHLGVYDAATGKRNLVSDVGWEDQEAGGWMTALAVSPVGTLAAGGSSKGKILLWDYSTGKLKHELKGPASRILEAEFTADGKQLIVASRKEGIHVWDVETGQQEQSPILSDPKTGGNAIAFSSDGTLFAEGSKSRLNVRNMKTGAIIWSKTGKDRSSFTECTFSSDSKQLAAYHWTPEKTSLYVYDASDGNIVSEVIMVPRPTHTANNLRFFDENRMLVVSHEKSHTRLWDIASGQLLQQIDDAESADVSPDGKTIVTKGPGSTVRTWQLDNQQLQLALAGPTITADNATYETLRSGSWQKFYSNADDLPQDDNITFKDGKITLDDRKLRVPDLLARNVAVRARIRKESGPRGFSIHVRSKVKPKKDDGTLVVPNDGFESDFAFWVHGPRSTAGINRIKAGQRGRKELAKATLDLTSDEFELLVAAIDDRLLYFVDSKLVMETRDASVSDTGEIVLGSYSAKFSMSNVAVRVLDGPSRSISPTDDWVDLIPNIDTRRDTISGNWESSEGSLELASGGKINLLRLPAQPDGSYEVECSFTRHVVSGDERGISLVLPTGGRHVAALFCSYGKNQLSGLASINGVSALDEASPCRTSALQIDPEKRHVISARVTVSGDVAEIQASADGRPLFSWKGNVDLLSVKFSDDNVEPNGQILLACPSTDKTTFHNLRWRKLGAGLTVENGDLVKKPAIKNEATLTRLARLDGTAVSPYAAYALAISPDGSLLLDSITTDGYLRARKVTTGEIVKLPFQSPKNVTAAAYSADGETLLIGTSESKVYVQPLKPGRRPIELTTVHPVVRKVVYDNRGRVLVFSNGTSRRSEGAVQRFIVSTRKEVGIVRFKQNQGYCPCLVSFTADGSRVAIINDNRAILYDLDAKKQLPIQFEPHIKLPSVAYGWASGVAISSESKQLMTWGYDMRIRVSDAESGNRILSPLLHLAQVKPPELPSHLHPSRGLFSPDRRWFVNSYTSGVSGATIPGEIVLRDAATGEEIVSEIIPNAPSTGKSKYNESYVTRLVLSNDGRYLAAAGSAMQIHVWRIDQQNDPPTEALARTISVDFRRKPFAEAMQEIGKLAGIEIRLDAEGLKSQGYTLNMSQNVRMNDKTVQDVIEAIVRRYRKMSWRINGNHILITAGDSSQAANGSEYQQLTAGNWTRVLNKRSEFAKVQNARLTSTGILLIGTGTKSGDAHVGIRESTGSKYLKASDFALRMKVKRQQGREFYVLFRQIMTNGYVISTNGRDTISAIKKTGFTGVEKQVIEPHSIEVDDSDWVEWMLVARGTTMTVYADGREVLKFTDKQFHSGGIAIGTERSRVQFKEVELQLLQSGNAGSTAVPTNSTPSK